MELLPLSFLAGILTFLAPCVLPILPVVFARSAEESKNGMLRPGIIIISALASIFLVTLLFRSFVAVFAFDLEILYVVAGVILIVFGIFTLYPEIWDWISVKSGLNRLTGQAVANASKFTKTEQRVGSENKTSSGGLPVRKSYLGDIVLGSALGPVFTSCSPTYAVIIATVLPQDLFTGALNLVVYCIGFGLMLFLGAILGQSLIKRLKWAVNPHGIFKKIVGITFVILGVLIVTGLIKDIEAALLALPVFTDLVLFEASLMN